MGPNVLLTVRGRASGEPRFAAVAVAEIDGHRYVIGAYGEVQWVKNLRAAGEADIRIHGKTEHVTAHELDAAASLDFFSTALPGFIAHFPRLGRGFARVMFGSIVDQVFPDQVARPRRRHVA